MQQGDQRNAGNCPGKCKEDPLGALTINRDGGGQKSDGGQGKILAERDNARSRIDANCAGNRVFEGCLCALPDWVGEYAERKNLNNDPQRQNGCNYRWRTNNGNEKRGLTRTQGVGR